MSARFIRTRSCIWDRERTAFLFIRQIDEEDEEDDGGDEEDGSASTSPPSIGVHNSVATSRAAKAS